MTRKLFGTDGVRGLANKFPMTPEIAMKVGMAAGRIFTRGEHRHRVVIGKDTRLSGYMIESALVAGFTAVGMDVFQFGPLPTPAVAMLTRSLRADIGVMISASHNAFHDNGIKLFGPDGEKLSDAHEMEIESLMMSGLEEGLASADSIGRAKRIDDSQARYIEFAKRTFPRNHRLDGLRIVLDCANGAAYRSRRPCCGSSARTSSASASIPTAPTSITNAARPRPRRCSARCAPCAPISALRSTATPIAW